MEEALLKVIENAIQKMEQKKNYSALKAVKADLKFLKISIETLSNPELKKSLLQRVKDCEKRVSLLNDKPMPSASKSTLFNRNQDSLEILENARSELAKAEEYGVITLRELDKQKATIKRTKENLTKVDSKLETSNGILDQMSKWWRG